MTSCIAVSIQNELLAFGGDAEDFASGGSCQQLIIDAGDCLGGKLIERRTVEAAGRVHWYNRHDAWKQDATGNGVATWRAEAERRLQS
jgi:hypothetical protein